MPFVTSPDAVRVKYELVGDGPPLFLHLGAGCDSSVWDAAGYLEPLAKSYQCILFDHRGHGESDKPRGIAANHLDRYEDDVVALLDHLGIESTSFWGYSAGIDVGLKVAYDHPSRIRSLVGSGGLGRTSPEDFAQFVARRVPELKEHRWEKMLDRFDVQESEPVPAWMKERIRATDVQQFVDSLLAAPGWDDWEALPRISAPTLFITGELEDPHDGTGEGVARMPNGRRVRIAGQGHINAFLRSDLALPHVLEFLGTNAIEVARR